MGNKSDETFSKLTDSLNDERTADSYQGEKGFLEHKEDKDFFDNPTVMISPTKKPLLIYFYFVLLGIVTLISWNSVLSTTHAIGKGFLYLKVAQYEQIDELHTRQLLLFCCANLISQFVLLIVGSLHITTIYIFTIFNTILSILYPFITVSERIDGSCIENWMYIFSFFFGLCTGFLQGTSFSLASIFPVNFVTAIIVGHGIAGLIPPLIATFFNTLYDHLNLNKVKIVPICFSDFFMSGVFSIIIAALTLFIQWNKLLPPSLFQAKKSKQVELMNTSDILEIQEEDLPRRNWELIMKNSAFSMLLVFLTFFFALHVFPRIGPLKWNWKHKDTNEELVIQLLFLAYAVGDFFGKLMPDIGNSASSLNWMRIPRNIFKYFVFSKLIVYVFYYLPYFFKEEEVINDIWYVFVTMIIHAFTSGWQMSLCVYFATMSVTRNSEKAIVAPVAVIILILGMIVGLFTAYFYPNR